MVKSRIITQTGSLASILALLATAAGCYGQAPSPEQEAEETAEALQYGPDLVVTSVTGPASTVGQFNTSLTVCNQGTAPSYGTNVELRLSTDATITASDIFAGGTTLPGLDAGQCTTVSLPGGGPVPPGAAYYLGAIVDPNNGVFELNESNNALAGSLIGIGYGPDLIVSSVTGPASSTGPFTASVTVCNQGTASSNGANVELRLSTDATITTADTFAGGVWVSGLPAGQCATVSVPGGGPVPLGAAYYLGAVIDPNNNEAELIESNNTLAGSLIGIGYGPDLVVNTIVSPSSSTGPFNASVTVCNQGTASSYGANVELRLSTDATITAADTFAGGAWLPTLNAGQCTTLSFPAGGPVPPGVYYLGALVDLSNGVSELIESNNAFSGNLIAIGNGPDLVVSSVTAPASSTGPFNASVTVCNQGTASSYGANVELRLSTDATITAADTFAGGTWVPSLNAGQCTTVSFPAGGPVPSGRLIISAPSSIPATTYPS